MDGDVEIISEYSIFHDNPTTHRIRLIQNREVKRVRIQNYGEWKGDKPGGHHPPACTCYRCNEERRAEEAAKEEERRAKEYDRRVAEEKARGKAIKQQGRPNRTPSTSKPIRPSSENRTNRTSPQGRTPSRSTAPQSRQQNQAPLPSQAKDQRPRANQPKRPAQTGSQRRAAQAVQRSAAGTRPTAPTRSPAPTRRPRRQETKLFRISKAVTASAMRYATALHIIGPTGLVMYALVQGGTSKRDANSGWRCGGIRGCMADAGCKGRYGVS